MPIHFSKIDAPYGFLSNFAPYPITLDDRVWPTSEHYFQGQKFVGTDYAERIRQTRSPMIAARLGRSRSQPIRSDWDEVKEEVMLHALRAKFGQHVDIRDQLLATGEEELIERTPRDAYWGDGPDGKGQNRLGVLLMRVRAEFRTSESA